MDNETQQEVTEAIQSDIPHALIQEVMGVTSAQIAAWVSDDGPQMTPAERRRFRRAFAWIYRNGDEFRPGDETEIWNRVRSIR